MKYRLVTGYYPSEESANKVLSKVKAHCKNAKIINEDGVFYTVCIDTFLNYETAHGMKTSLVKEKIFCGIEAVSEL